MKKWNLSVILVFEAIFFILLFLFGGSNENILTLLISSPWKIVAQCLRVLSLTGMIGNIFAIIFYLIFCSIPLLYFGFRFKKEQITAPDFLLVGLSIILFSAIFTMINPMFVAKYTNGIYNLPIIYEKYASNLINSLLFGYFLFRVLEVIRNSELMNSFMTLKSLLSLVCIYLVYLIFGEAIASGISSYTNMTGNTDMGLLIIFAFYIKMVLPYWFALKIILTLTKLIDAMNTNIYNDSILEIIGSLKNKCYSAAGWIVTLQLIAEAAQFVLGPNSSITQFDFTNSLLPLVCILLVLVLANYFNSAVKLKEDNDSII